MSITLSEARAMASDAAYIEDGDVGRLAILAEIDGQDCLVDLAEPGNTQEQAVAAYLRRIGEDDDGTVRCEQIDADQE